MNRFHRSLVSLWPLAALGVLAWGGSTPILAQPPNPDEENVAISVPATEAAWDKLREAVGEQEFSDPAAAIARYQQFYEEQGRGSVQTAIKITRTIAQLYWQRLGNRAKALEIYDWAIAKYGAYPRGSRLQAERDLVAAQDSPRNAGGGNAAPVTLPVEKLKTDVAAAPIELPAPTNAPTILAPVAPPISPLTIGPLTVNTRMAALKDYLSQWRKGVISWEQLVKDAQMTSTEALEVLSAPSLVSGWSADKALRLHLAELMQRDADVVREPTKLAPAAQHALGEYDATQGNERAELLFENLLQMELPEGRHPQKLFVLERLAQYYAGKGELERAAQTALEAGKYSDNENWRANMTVAAARYLMQAGETEKANALYKQVEKSGAGWAKGLALYDQAKLLLAENKYKEARVLLHTPIAGEYAEQIKIVLLSALAKSYYSTGDFGLAKQYSQQAMDQVGKLELLRNEDLEGYLSIADATLS